MKRNTAIIFVIAVLCLGVILTSVIYTYTFIEDRFEYEMHVKVDNYMGFNLDTDKIYFGTVPPGQGAERRVTIKGRDEYPVRVVFKVSGPLADYVSVEDNGFILNAGEVRNITLNVHVPKDAELNTTMTGKLHTILYKRWR